jgi:hypothetical protein
MTALRIALRRLIAGAMPEDAGVHFHRRGGVAEVCYDSDCAIPRLSARDIR